MIKLYDPHKIMIKNMKWFDRNANNDEWKWGYKIISIHHTEAGMGRERKKDSVTLVFLIRHIKKAGNICQNVYESYYWVCWCVIFTFFLYFSVVFFSKFPTMEVIYYYQTKKKTLNIFKDEHMPVQKVISRSFSIRSR